MYRMIPYRGFEIHVTLTLSAEDMYEVTMQIKGGTNFGIIGDGANAIQLRHGPFTRRVLPSLSDSLQRLPHRRGPGASGRFALASIA
jgi:hypothetical protein